MPMNMGVVFIIVSFLIWVLMGVIGFVGDILTLDFLPNGLDILNDSKMQTYSIPIIGFLINYIVWVFVNLVDFVTWFIHWIPGVKTLMDIIYTCPDLDLPNSPLEIFRSSHRNFITHSALNPIFIVFIIVSSLVSGLVPRNPIGTLLAIVALIIGLTFSCHLLADTMPRGWMGTAFIQVKLYGHGLFTLGNWFSQIWLYINAIIAIILSSIPLVATNRE